MTSEPLSLPPIRPLATEINTRIRDVAEAFAFVSGEDVPIDFICECGCVETTPTTLAAYAALSGHRLIAPGHPHS